MNIEKLLEDNLLSKEYIKKWFRNKYIESSKLEKNIPQDFIDAFIEYNISDVSLINNIEKNPHVLFEMFDENEIFIEVYKDTFGFSFTINKSNFKSSYFILREKAECSAINKAVELLENKLKETNTNG